MSSKRNHFRDRFTFSLRGMTATASFFITPVIADDTINNAWDQNLRCKEQGRADDKEKPGTLTRRSVSRAPA